MAESETSSNSKSTRRRASLESPAIASGERALALGARARGRAARGSAAPTAADLAVMLADAVGQSPQSVPGAGFFEENPDAILRFDRTQRIVYANPALARATALPRSAFIGHLIGDVAGFEAYAPLWRAKLDDLFESEEARWFKFTVAHPMGAKLFDVRLSPERGPDARSSFATAVLRDVTVPRYAMRASRDADEFLDTILTSARIGIAVLDRDLRYRVWNSHLELLLGIPAEKVLGRTPIEAFGFDAESETMRALERMRDGSVRATQPQEYPFPVTAGTGPGPWVRVRPAPMFDSRGAFDGVFLTIERIDRERFAETSLAALRQALDSAGEMVLEIERSGTIVDANETALAWLGYGRESLKGMPLQAIDMTLTVERYADILEQLTGRGAYQGEARYRTRLGSEFSVDVVLQRVEHGEREFIFLLVRDISDRKQVEEALADSAARFRTIFEESPVANLLLDAKFRIVQANRAACVLLGYDPQILVGQDPAMFLHPDDSDAVKRLRARLAEGNVAAAESDRRLRRRDGHTLWSRLTVRAWSSAAGERHYLLVLEDFTDRKTSDDQLQVALRDQQTLLATMSVGVAQTLQGRILLANREFAQMFGYDDDEVVGMSLWDLTHDRAEKMMKAMSGLPAVRPHETTIAEVVLFRKDSRPIWCLVQARAVDAALDVAFGADGAVRAGEAIYTFQDVSESKQQREALERSLLELSVVFDATSIALIHLANGHIVRANAQAARMFAPGGAAGAALDDAEFASLFASRAEFDEHEAATRAQLESGAPVSFEARMNTRSGIPTWALVSLRAIDARRPAGGQIASILDIGARRAQEEQLQTLLAESQLIFDTALVGLLFVRDGRPVRANSAMEELLACEPGGLTSQIQLFAHPTDQLLSASLAEHYAEINERGACEFELSMYRRKGDPIWVAVQGRAVNPERPDLGYIFAFVNIDERKRQEAQLRATLNELQLIFDNALVGMVYVSDDLIIKANVATERLFGYTAPDLRELQIASLFADPDEWLQVLHQLGPGDNGSDSDGEVTFERLLRRRDGSTFWGAGNARPLDHGAPSQGLILALSDVDARRRSEDELRRMRNYLDLVVENLPVLVSVRDADTGRFVSLNRAGETITGLRRDQVIGRTWHEVYGRQFADLYAEMDRRALADGHQVDRPRDVMLRADGRTLTVNQRIVPLFEADSAGRSRVRYVMSIVDDLTDAVRAETQLAETETRFRQFAENIDQLVFIATTDLSAVLYVNPRYASVVGAAASELIENPRSALAHVHFDDAPRVARLLPRLIASMRRARKMEFNVRIDHPLRGVRMLNVRLSPVRLRDGTIRVFGIADDVTERSAAERQRLEEAVKQRDILVREVHHRIKNNLQGVAGLLQHMAHAKPELAYNLNEIAGQIQAIAQVHGLQIRATGTLPVLGVAQGIFQNLATMFGVEVRFEPPPPALWRWGLPENEAVPLALVVNELGTNAIKYRGSREQGISVRVGTRPDGVELRIENPGQLRAGFDLSRIASSVSGLGLVKALLPRRGAKLAIEQHGGIVVTRLELVPPAIGEDVG
ncbi:MAG TPA: PAS domain S-box protein [Burkholderiaceae bacterium]|nr:PAS domain S-box protein [Burkholderiaceae bacterium]